MLLDKKDASLGYRDVVAEQKRSAGRRERAKVNVTFGSVVVPD